MVVTRGWGRGKGTLLFNGTESQFAKMRKIVWSWRRWLPNNAEVLNATELGTSMVKMVHFQFRIF